MIGRCLILLLISCESYAQTYLGPRYQAMGNTGAALEGIYSLTANPAGLVGVDGVTASLNHQHHFLTSEIVTQAALLALPTRLGVFGLSAKRYGAKMMYDDVMLGFTFAKAFGPQLAIGLSTNYHRLYIPMYLSEISLSVDVGAQYRFGEAWIAGVQYTNVGQANYGVDVAGTIPSYLQVGVSYRLDQVVVIAEGVFGSSSPLGGRFGVEYALVGLLALRGGVSVNPLQQFAGFGVHWQGFTLDAAASFHPRLGMSPQIGICYAF